MTPEEAVVLDPPAGGTTAEPRVASRIDEVVDDKGRRNPEGRADAVIACLLVVGSLVLLTLTLAGTSIWADEAFTWGLVHQPVSVLGRYLWGPEANMSAYYVTLRGWLALAAGAHLGTSALVFRAPSILCGGLSVGVVFALARRLWSRSTALVGALLYGLNYVVLLQIGEARSYGAQMLFVCLSWYVLLPLVTGAAPSNGRKWALYVAVAAASVYLQLFSGFVLIAQLVVVWLAYRGLRRSDPLAAHRLRRQATAGFIGLGALLIPMLTDVAVNRHFSFVAPVGLHALVGTLWNFGGRSVFFTLVLVAVVSVAVLVQVRRLRSDRRDDPAGSWWAPSLPAVALWCWLLVPPVLSFVLTQPWLNFHVYGTLYLVTVVPPLCILAAIGVTSLQPKKLVAVAMVVVLGAGLLGLRTYIDTRQRQDFTAASTWVTGQWKPGDGLVCASWSCALALDYYFRRDASIESVLHSSPGHWTWSNHSVTAVDPEMLARYGAEHARVFFVSSPLQGDPASALQQGAATEGWFNRHCALVNQQTTSSYYGMVTSHLYDDCGAVHG